MAEPQSNTAISPALFNNIVQVAGTAAGGTVAAGAAAAAPIVAAVAAGINLLPPGGLKQWLSYNAVDFWKNIIQLFTGRKYTRGQYTLGERFIDNILGGSVGYSQVPDDVVPKATLLFTILFGVRITDSADLDALDSGTAAYYARPDKQDIPLAAVVRAVKLKQTYYPISTYNVQKWDTDYFSLFPLVAPIPDPLHVGQYYTGPLPGGGTATNGVIIVNAGTPLATVQTGAPAPGAGSSNKNLILIGLAALAALGLYYYSEK